MSAQSFTSIFEQMSCNAKYLYCVFFKLYLARQFHAKVNFMESVIVSLKYNIGTDEVIGKREKYIVTGEFYEEIVPQFLAEYEGVGYQKEQEDEIIKTYWMEEEGELYENIAYFQIPRLYKYEGEELWFLLLAPPILASHLIDVQREGKQPVRINYL